MSFTSVLVVACIALAAPLIVNLAPGLRVPAVVVEILLGIIVGPSLLDWARVDVPVDVLSLLGLGFLLFLAGLEIDPSQVRDGFGRIALAFGASCLLALGAGYSLELIHETSAPLFVAIALTSTSLGLVVPVLRDAGQTETRYGQLVLSACSVGEFGAIVLVSMLYSQNASSTESTVFLLGAFAVLVAAIGIALSRAGRSIRVSAALVRLDDTTAQLGVRVAVTILIVFVVLSSELGLETILGAFIAGALLRMVDRDAHLVHERFRMKVEAIGYGFIVPIFFVSSGLRFDAASLAEKPSHLLLVPAFLLALLVVRGVPALLYRSIVGTRRAIVAGLFQATSLTFLVVAAHLGRELEVFDAPTAAALITAGLVSVVLFPPIALALLGPDVEPPT